MSFLTNTATTACFRKRQEPQARRRQIVLSGSGKQAIPFSQWLLKMRLIGTRRLKWSHETLRVQYQATTILESLSLRPTLLSTKSCPVLSKSTLIATARPCRKASTFHPMGSHLMSREAKLGKTRRKKRPCTEMLKLCPHNIIQRRWKSPVGILSQGLAITTREEAVMPSTRAWRTRGRRQLRLRSEVRFSVPPQETQIINYRLTVRRH